MLICSQMATELVESTLFSGGLAMASSDVKLASEVQSLLISASTSSKFRGVADLAALNTTTCVHHGGSSSASLVRCRNVAVWALPVLQAARGKTHRSKMGEPKHEACVFWRALSPEHRKLVCQKVVEDIELFRDGEEERSKFTTLPT